LKKLEKNKLKLNANSPSPQAASVSSAVSPVGFQDRTAIVI
jgi:hypothetical protein